MPSGGVVRGEHIPSPSSPSTNAMETREIHSKSLLRGHCANLVRMTLDARAHEPDSNFPSGCPHYEKRAPCLRGETKGLAKSGSALRRWCERVALGPMLCL